MVYKRISEKLGFAARHLRWGPRRRSDDQKARRVQYSRSILAILRTQQARALYDIVTLDESWFYYIPDYELRWLPAGGKVPDRERVAIQSKNGAPYRIDSDWVHNGDIPWERMQIRRGLLCEQRPVCVI
jgi:hypothetical protein